MSEKMSNTQKSVINGWVLVLFFAPLNLIFGLDNLATGEAVGGWDLFSMLSAGWCAGIGVCLVSNGSRR